MKRLLSVSLLLTLAISAQAKIWRINNTVGVTADFTQITTAISSASVLAGDTLHVEPSATNYNAFTFSKPLVVIGTGYLLDTASALTHPNRGNAGLQAFTATSRVGNISCAAGGAGSVMIGVEIDASSYIDIIPSSGASINNYTFIKCRIPRIIKSASNGTLNNITIRKCFISGGGNSFDFSNTNNTSSSNVTIENCIFYNTPLQTSSFTTGCIIRNCTFDFPGGHTLSIVNAYFANNIVSTISSSNVTITGSTVKNNIFNNSPTLPAGSVGNQTNVSMASVFVNTGSSDARYMLAAGSPAIGAGVTIGGYTPDCGAFGGPDPYKLSGIPSIPSIYQLTVPATIPLNAPSMNITLSTRDNN